MKLSAISHYCSLLRFSLSQTESCCCLFFRNVVDKHLVGESGHLEHVYSLLYCIIQLYSAVVVPVQNIKKTLCMIYKHFENMGTWGNVLINHLLLVIPVIIFKCCFYCIFLVIVPGPAGYSYNKVAVAGTYFKYQFCLKRCDFLKRNLTFLSL